MTGSIHRLNAGLRAGIPRAALTGGLVRRCDAGRGELFRAPARGQSVFICTGERCFGLLKSPGRISEAVKRLTPPVKAGRQRVDDTVTTVKIHFVSFSL